MGLFVVLKGKKQIRRTELELMTLMTSNSSIEQNMDTIKTMRNSKKDFVPGKKDTATIKDGDEEYALPESEKQGTLRGPGHGIENESDDDESDEMENNKKKLKGKLSCDSHDDIYNEHKENDETKGNQQRNALFNMIMNLSEKHDHTKGNRGQNALMMENEIIINSDSSDD